MREFINIIENANAPDWFANGTPIDITAIDYDYDLLDVLSDEEMNYDWRICMVPARTIDDAMAGFHPLPTSTETELERLDSIHGWFNTIGIRNALMSQPPMAILTKSLRMLDGCHRCLLAIQRLRDIPVLVGKPS
jgi:hypothetical protein